MRGFSVTGFLWMLAWGFVLASGIVMVSGCGDSAADVDAPQVAKFDVRATAVDREGNPVAGVPVFLDSRKVGYTDSEGRFTGELTEAAGQKVDFGMEAPDGYRLKGSASEAFSLKTTKGVDGTPRGVPIEMRAELVSTRSEFFVWVHADCEDTKSDEACSGLPIKVDGDKIAETDASGRALFVLEREPEDVVDLVIETSEVKEGLDLRPANPQFEMALPFSAHAFVITQPFVNQAKKRRSKPSLKKRPDSDAFDFFPITPMKEKSRGRNSKKDKERQKSKPNRQEAMDLF